MRKKDKILKALTAASYVLFFGVALLTTGNDIEMWQLVICGITAAWISVFYMANKDRWIYKMD